MIRVGVIGYGYWGPNLVRNFSEAAETQVIAISDLDPERLRIAADRYPSVWLTTNHQALFSSPKIDAIAIATPVSTHYTFSMQALKMGKHVFVEKPLTETSEQAQWLIDEAEHQGLVLHVDHTFVYTGAVRKIRELVEGTELGDVYYYDSVRVNLGLFQTDVNVIWDLAVHDLAIMHYVFPLKPVAVSATGMSHIPGKPANIAYLSIFFDNNMIAHLHVNWLAPVKLRRTLIGGSRKMLVYDDLEPSEKVKVYDKGITLNGSKENLYQTLIGYRAGDMWAPQLDATEALRAEVSHFAQCVEQGKTSLTGGQAGLMVVRILEAAMMSMNARGQPVTLSSV